MVQEALTNVVKHAQARRLSLILNRLADEALVIIEDDGVGFDVESGTEPTRTVRRLGLTGMKQRVQAVGGVFQIESSQGGGTTIFVRFLPDTTARGDLMNKLRIVLADDHAVVREGLKALFRCAARSRRGR